MESLLYKDCYLERQQLCRGILLPMLLKCWILYIAGAILEYLSYRLAVYLYKRD